MAAAGRGVGRDVGEIYSSSTFLARADKRQQQHGISEVFPDFEFFRSLVFKTLNCWGINAFDSIFFEIFQSSLVSSKLWNILKQMEIRDISVRCFRKIFHTYFDERILKLKTSEDLTIDNHLRENVLQLQELIE